MPNIHILTKTSDFELLYAFSVVSQCRKIAFKELFEIS